MWMWIALALAGFLVWFIWWLETTPDPQKMSAPTLDRKARFKLYIEGEKQLMVEWEEAFDPVGTAFAKDIAIEMRRAKDNARLFGSPYKAISTGVYADRKDYRCFDGWSQTFPCTAEEFNKQRMAA